LRRDDRRCGELAVEWQQLAAFADFEAAAASDDRVAGETAAPHSKAYGITQRYEPQILPGGLVAQVPGADDAAHGQARHPGHINHRPA